jgi:hypothetical protein
MLKKQFFLQTIVALNLQMPNTQLILLAMELKSEMPTPT